MVSPSQQTYSIRRRKKTNQGKRRKRVLRARGSTPKFPLHPEGKPAAKPGK
ncbi:MAG: hypothetical protein JXB32_02470 [Deltaproteobacteria bacterium]|nr:hypothetical protein [Deltaproteobacteria bacterium]